MNAENSSQAEAYHLDYLDSARGIAAMMVIAYHFINWKYETYLGAKLFSIVFNGSDAVSFFFVLSGFVLSYKYIVLNQPLDIRKFYINRVFRLWPAFFITISLNALNSIRGDLSLHNLGQLFLFNKSFFWEEALMFRSHPNFFIPSWTLVIELVLSFFIPFIIALAKQNKTIIYWLLLAYIIIGNSMRDLYMFHIHFTLGVLISCLFYQVKSMSFRETKWFRYRYIILAGAFLFFSIRHLDRIWPLGATYNYIAGYWGITFFHYTAIASFVFIIVLICNNNLQRLLRHKILLFLGKISYGIYLMHWLIVTNIFQYWDQILSWFPNYKIALSVVFLVYTGITIALAALLHYAVELPFIRMGKRLTKRLAPSFQI